MITAEMDWQKAKSFFILPLFTNSRDECIAFTNIYKENRDQSFHNTRDDYLFVYATRSCRLKKIKRIRLERLLEGYFIVHFLEN